MQQKYLLCQDFLLTLFSIFLINADPTPPFHLATTPK